jgi:hypothetical protein
LNYFLSQGDFIALGRIRIWDPDPVFYSEVGSGSGHNGPDPPKLAVMSTVAVLQTVFIKDPDTG